MRLEMRGQKSLESQLQFRKLLIFLPMQFWWTRNCLKLQIKWTRKTFDQNMGIDLCAKLCVCDVCVRNHRQLSIDQSSMAYIQHTAITAILTKYSCMIAHRVCVYMCVGSCACIRVENDVVPNPPPPHEHHTISNQTTWVIQIHTRIFRMQ